MIYEGQAITVSALDNGLAEVQFDLKGESVNKFDRQTLQEFREVVDRLKADNQLKGVLVTSAKNFFIVGADITEFVASFQEPEESIYDYVQQVNSIFNDFEDLPLPTVVAINGTALGGGFEVCLAADIRVMADTAVVGLPEVKLGIFPGFGGTVRLPRVIGADNAIEWIATGKEQNAETALKVGAVDAVTAPEKLRDVALAMLQQAANGELDYLSRRQPKLEKLKLGPIEQMMCFESAKAVVAGQAGPHMPAPLEATKAIQKAASMGRDKALEVESKGFAKLAKTDVAACLIGLFINDQLLKRQAKQYEKKAQPGTMAALTGAGIIGGGIAYQSD